MFVRSELASLVRAGTVTRPYDAAYLSSLTSYP